MTDHPDARPLTDDDRQANWFGAGVLAAWVTEGDITRRPWYREACDAKTVDEQIAILRRHLGPPLTEEPTDG